MTQNDFFVAIQGIMTEAHEKGWSLDWVYNNAEDAVNEWLEEMEGLDDTVLD